MESLEPPVIESPSKDQNNESAEEQVFKSKLVVNLKKSQGVYKADENSVPTKSSFLKIRERFVSLENHNCVENNRSRVFFKKELSVENKLNNLIDSQDDFVFNEHDNVFVNNVDSVIVNDEHLTNSTNKKELSDTENIQSETEVKTGDENNLDIEVNSNEDKSDTCEIEPISPAEKTRNIVKTIEHLVDNVPIFKDILKEFSEVESKKHNLKNDEHRIGVFTEDNEISVLNDNTENISKTIREKIASLNSTCSSSDDDENIVPKIVENPGSAKPIKGILKKPRKISSSESTEISVEPKKTLTIDVECNDTVEEHLLDDLTETDSWVASKPLDKIVEDTTGSNEKENPAKSRLTESQLKIEKLQQSLPTKLSSSTVETLKTKYTPVNYGYQQPFVKTNVTSPSIFSSKIPLLSPIKLSSIKPVQNDIPPILNKTDVNVEQVPLEINKTDLEHSVSQSIKDKSIEKDEVKNVTKDKILETEPIIKLNISDNNNNRREDLQSDLLEENIILGDYVKNNKPGIEENISSDKSIENNLNSNEIEETIEKTHSIQEIVQDKIVENNQSEELDQFDEEDSLSLNNSIDCSSSNTFIDSNSVSSIKTLDESKDLSNESDNDVSLSDELKDKQTDDGYADLIKVLNMNENKKSSKKRTSSFRKLLPSLFGSSKHKEKTSSDAKNFKLVQNSNGQRKPENNFVTDNYQNEVQHFERSSVERHTISHYPLRMKYVERNVSEQECSSVSNSMNHPNYNAPNIQIQDHFQYPEETDSYSIPIDSCDSFNKRSYMRNNNDGVQLDECRTDEYVCMANSSQVTNNQQNIDKMKSQYMNIKDVSKYIDTSTSSSNSTLISDHNLSGRENLIERIPQNTRPMNRNELMNSPGDYSKHFNEKTSIADEGTRKFINNPEKFNEESFNTEPNDLDPLLIKPKAIIPITTERQLPNPYHNSRDSFGMKRKSSSPDELYQNSLCSNRNIENSFNNETIKNEESLTYDLLINAIPSSTPKNETKTKEMKTFSNTANQTDRNLQTFSTTPSETTPNKNINSNSTFTNYTDNIFYRDSVLPKQPYETVYGNIRKSTNDNKSLNSSDPYNDLVSVSAEVKITRQPIINTKKSLRARSLSPEQRYKLDIPKQVSRFNQLETNKGYNQQQPIENLYQNDRINRNHTPGELVEIRVENANTSPKILNSQGMKKSPKNERKMLKKSLSDVGKKNKTKNDIPTHQKLEIELDYPENFNQTQKDKVTPQKDVYLNRKDRFVPIERKVLTKKDIKQNGNGENDMTKLPVRKDSRSSMENRTRKVTSPVSKDKQMIQNDKVVVPENQNVKEQNTSRVNEMSYTKDVSKMSYDYNRHPEQKAMVDNSESKQLQQDQSRNKLEYVSSVETPRPYTEPQYDPREHPSSSKNISRRNFDSPINIDTTSPTANSSPSPRHYKVPLSPQHLQNLRNVEIWAIKQKEQMSPNNASYKLSPNTPPGYQNSINGSITTKAVVHHNPSERNYQIVSYSNIPVKHNNIPPSTRITQASETRNINSSPNLQQQVSLQKKKNFYMTEMMRWQIIKEKRDREEHEFRLKEQILRQRDDMNLPHEHKPRMSGGLVRNGRRSASLPRNLIYTPPHSSIQYESSIRRPEKIPEHSVQQTFPNSSNKKSYQCQMSHPDYGYLRHRAPERPVVQPNNNNNFVRGSGQRSTIGPISTQKVAPSPITEDVIYENYFPDVQLRHQCQSYKQPPIFKRGSLNEQFIQQDNEIMQKKVSFSGAQNTNILSTEVWPSKNGFVQSPPTRRNRNVSVISVGDDSVFLEPSEDNGKLSKHTSKCYPVEPQYGKTIQKQVTVTDKVCDFYGKIHDTNEKRVVTSPSNYGHIQKSGVIYGELKRKSNITTQSPSNDPYISNETGNMKKIDTQLDTRMNKQAEIQNIRKHDQVDTSRLIDMRNSQLLRNQRKIENPTVKYQPTNVPLMPKVPNKISDIGNQVHEAPNRPLPPIPRDNKRMDNIPRASNYPYGDGRVGVRSMMRSPNTPESESGSEAGEIQRILSNMTVSPQYQHQRGRNLLVQEEEEWNADGKSRGPPGSDSGGGGGGNADVGELRGGGPRGSRSTRREDPRRHTLSGDQHLYPPGPGQGGVLTRTMDLEGNLPRGYPPPSNAMLFDDDPGIMSEVETSSTGFRRGGKQRSSLPVVRTPSKTLERPLGLVFLQYRNETKRALLPNEITSIDTVKALFVRSFPKQLTMEYLDSPLVKIYIHDSSKDMFYELEDLRSHLRDIRDRSVLRLFESADVTGGLPGPGTGITGGVGHFEDQSYFSEPEFDSEYQHQHIHKSKTSGKNAPPYYMGSATTLPRGGPLLRAYSPAVGAPVPADRIKSITGPAGTNSAPPKPVRAGTYPAGAGSLRGAPPGRYAPFLSPAELRHAPDSGLYSLPDRIHSDGYMSSPERGSRGQYEDPYYSQYAPRSGSMTPVIDEEARIRVEHMERQLANLTGLVQKALTQTPNDRPTTRDFLQVPAGRENFRTDKSVSFEKSVSFSDEPPDMNSPKQHSPQHAERDRLKPAPPPKPAALAAVQYESSRHIYRDLQLTPEMYNQLRGLQKKAKDLRAEVRNLRRMSQAQAHSVRETIRDTFIKIRSMLIVGGEQAWQAGVDQEKIRLSREEDLYKQEMLRLEKDLTDLESTVEELRGNVINRKTRVNMSDVENMALILSKSSKTVADLKVRFPGLQEGLKSMLTSEMEKVVREEKFLKEEPDRLESALRRCKKLTGTLVTLKRLASVQEQRLPCANSTTPDGRLSPPVDDTPPITPTSGQHGKPIPVPAARPIVAPGGVGGDADSIESGQQQQQQRPENALDALLDELQTFSRPTVDPVRKSSGEPHALSVATGGLRRLHSYPSGSDTDNSPPLQPAPRGASSKPPLPERSAELMHALAGRRAPPPPPPRTSSRSPLASPTSPGADVSGPRRGGPGRGSVRERTHAPLEQSSEPPAPGALSASSSCESVNSQEGARRTAAGGGSRQEQLEIRHQELLRKQRALQEQYARLQQLQRGSGGALTVVPPAPDLLLKKTGSESNLLQKMGLSMSAPPFTGSLTHLAKPSDTLICDADQLATTDEGGRNSDTLSSKSDAAGASTTSKVYETDIL